MNITLTPAQVETITVPAIQQYKARLAIQENGHSIKVKALQRAANAKVDRANVRTAEWKERYNTTRKLLLAAQAEITTLKRRIRNAEWEE